MKLILLSADSPPSVYSVPDAVAENLNDHCIKFYQWLETSPHAEKYRLDTGHCYSHPDFIEYLNTWIFPDEPSTLVEELPNTWREIDLPPRYSDLEWYKF